MPGITKSRYTAIAATAARTLGSVGGVAVLDEMTTDAAASVIVGLYKQLADVEGISTQSARTHIVRAMRQARFEDWQPPEWGTAETAARAREALAEKRKDE